MSVTIVTDNPNKTVAVFRVDQDLLVSSGGVALSKVFIEKSGNLKSFSPMAQDFMRAASLQAPSRIDLIARPDKSATDIAFARGFEWREDEIQAIRDTLSGQGKEYYLNVDSVVDTVPVRAKFDPGKDPVKQFTLHKIHTMINPGLAVDGGALEVTEVNIVPAAEPNKKDINIEGVLVGACNGCSLFASRTAQNAVNALNTAFDNEVKAKYPDNKILQSLHYSQINTQTLSDLVIAR